MDLWNGYTLILASASPRRKELLGQIGIDPLILPSSADEDVPPVSPEAYVRELAKRKAGAVRDEILRGEIHVPKGPFAVLGADTIVCLEGEILGKPGNAENAAKMLRALSGRTHIVYTGAALLTDDGREDVFAEATEVDVSPLTEAEILDYIAGGEPFDKAGAYGIQGTFAKHIGCIRGDYSNVVGLPLAAVYRHLKELLCASD